MAKWAEVPQKITYEASDDGRILRAAYSDKGAKLRRQETAHGYQVITMAARFYVHRLVWQAFRGPIPNGYEINHRDGNRANNRLDNLELVTRSENMLHSYRYLSPSLNRVRGIKHHKAKLTPNDVTNILVLRQSGLSLMKIGRRYNVSDVAIDAILKGRSWSHITGIKQT